jgi:hypothetical protein
MSHAELSGRVSLFAGLSAAFIAASFGYLHRMILLDWPDIAPDGPDRCSPTSWLAPPSSSAFLCCVLLRSCSARPPVICGRRESGSPVPVPALVAYALYVRACLNMIR